MKKLKISNKKKFIYTLIFLLVFCFLFISILNKKSVPYVMDYTNFQIKRISIDVLRNTGTKEINKLIKKNKLYDIEKNNNGEIESINFNTVLLNEAMVIIANNVRKKLLEIQNGKNIPNDMNRLLSKNLNNTIIYMVPIGISSGNIFFMSLGPKIPVKIEYIGDIGVDIKTSVKPYGTNSALIEAYIYIEVFQKSILPFKSEELKISSQIPIIMEVVKGNVYSLFTNEKNSYNLPIN